MDLWKLEIVDSGGHIASIWGSEDAMGVFYEDFKEALTAPDGTGAKFLEVHGIFDSADRSEVRRLIRVEDISNVTVMKMY